MSRFILHSAEKMNSLQCSAAYIEIAVQYLTYSATLIEPKCNKVACWLKDTFSNEPQANLSDQEANIMMKIPYVIDWHKITCIKYTKDIFPQFHQKTGSISVWAERFFNISETMPQ